MATFVIEKTWMGKDRGYSEDKLSLWKYVENEDEARSRWYISQSFDKYGVTPIAINANGGFHSLDNGLQDERIYKVVTTDSDEFPLLSDILDNDKVKKMFNYGWIAPDGTCYPCEECCHIESAYVLCRRFIDPDVSVIRADDLLLEKGWVKVTTNNSYFAFKDDEKLTNEQAKIILEKGFVHFR